MSVQTKPRAKPTPVPSEVSAIKRARLAQKVSVRELARRLGVTPGAVSQMERSEARGSIGLSTLRRALAALGIDSSAELPTSARSADARAPFERREDRVAFELHRAVAKKLIDDPVAVRAVIPKNVARLREHVHGRLAMGWLDRWAALADAPVGVLIDAMLSTDELGSELRQNSPFMGVLTQDERLAAIGRASR